MILTSLVDKGKSSNWLEAGIVQIWDDKSTFNSSQIRLVELHSLRILLCCPVSSRFNIFYTILFTSDQVSLFMASLPIQHKFITSLDHFWYYLTWCFTTGMVKPKLIRRKNSLNVFNLLQLFAFEFGRILFSTLHCPILEQANSIDLVRPSFSLNKALSVSVA